MPRPIQALIVVAAVFVCGPGASAQRESEVVLDAARQAWFYNRVGTSVDEMLGDLRLCQEFGARIRLGPAISRPTAGLGHDAVASLIVASRSRDRVHNFADDCMVTRGYRRFDVVERGQAEFQAQFASMDADAQNALISAETPPAGTLARSWDNSHWLGEETDSTGLVLLPPPQVVDYFYGATIRPVTRTRPIRIDASAVAIGAVRGDVQLVLLRIVPQTGEAAPVPGARSLPAADAFSLTARRRGGADGADIQVFEIPAGTYALAYLATPSGLEHLCLRTVAFTVDVGDVVHLGKFTFDHGNARSALRIDRGDLEQGRARLAAWPEIAARLDDAGWRNGAVAPCSAWIPHMRPPLFYGLDMPGASPLERPPL